MSEKDFSGKLSASMRRARQSATALEAPTAPDAAPAAPLSRYARQDDQAPPASLDRPWDNLHPARIWPD
jgi:hypothetical protein